MSDTVYINSFNSNNDPTRQVAAFSFTNGDTEALTCHRSHSMKEVELGFQHPCSTVSDKGKGMSLPSWELRPSTSARHNTM